MNTNSIAFTALCKEYCSLLDGIVDTTPSVFIGRLLRMLPRIYIVTFDLTPDDASADGENGWFEKSLTEEEYDIVKERISMLMGEQDVYLEVFEEDMKYSETPVASTISENLADLYQVFFDFLSTVRLGTDELVDAAVVEVKNSFKEYWAATLCNVLRALNYIWTHEIFEED